MIRFYFTLLFFISITALNCSQPDESKKTFLTGSDVLLSKEKYLIAGKRISLVINHTSILSNGPHLLDTLLKFNDIKIQSVLSPEHGFKGNVAAGQKIKDSIDNHSSIKIYSLYGKAFKPTKKMLEETDVIVFDIQDIGARFYTYISTLFYVLQAAAENNIPIIILDRPNPYSGEIVNGPVLDKSMQSFIGIAPIPVMHGMTIGELALLFSGENYLGKNLHPEIKVIKMEGWEREFFLDELPNKWINPSPNIKDFETILVYPATCLIEGTNVSEGRGTSQPFKQIGAPFINSEELIDDLKLSKIEGVEVSPVKFIPQEIPGVAESPKFKGVECNGISIKITDKNKFDAIRFGLQLISSLLKLYEAEFKFNVDHFDSLIGNKNIRQMIIAEKTIDVIFDSWFNELESFKIIRKKYLLY